MPTSINFGSVEVGKAQSRAVFVENTSEAALAFQFVTDDGGSFTLSKYQGVLPAKLEIPVKFTFSPDRPINYYRRLFLLVEGRTPLFVDLLGTAYVSPRGDVKEQRPAPLRHAHLQAARNRIAAGMGACSPDELEATHDELARKGPTKDEMLLFARIGAKGHDDVLLKTRVANPVTRSGEATRAEVQVAHDLFAEYDRSNADREIVVSCEAVDFGFQSADAAAERRRTVTVTNATRAKITVAWKAAPSVFVDGTNKGPDFLVSPAQADVPAGGSRDFRVQYTPKRDNTYSLVDLEAVAYFKSQRSFRLVNDAVRRAGVRSLLRSFSARETRRPSWNAGAARVRGRWTKPRAGTGAAVASGSRGDGPLVRRRAVRARVSQRTGDAHVPGLPRGRRDVPNVEGVEPIESARAL